MSRFIKSYLLVLSALFISQTSFTQQKITQLSTSWSSLNQESTLDYFSPPDQKYLGLVIGSGDSAKIIITNSSFKSIYQFSIGRSIFEEFSGAFIRNDSIAVFMAGDNYIHSWVCDVKTGKVIEHKISFRKTSERFIGALSTGKKYLHIYVKKNEPFFVIYDFDGKDKYDRTEYDLSDQTLNTGLNDKELNKSLTKSKFLRRVIDVAIVEDTEIPTPETCLNPTKLYVRRDSLFIISNKKNRLIDIYTLHLKDKTRSYRSIDFGASLNTHFEDSSYCYNSFLMGNEIYYVWGNTDSLNLSVNDFYTGKEVKQFHTFKDDSLIFNNIQPNNAHTISSRTNENLRKYKDYKSVEDFLIKASNGQALIYVYKNSSGLNEITIGTVGKKHNVDAGPTVWINSLGEMRATPTVAIKKWKTLNKFNFAFDRQTGLISAGNMAFNVFEKTDQYKTGMKIKDNAEAVLAFQNNIYLIYLDKTIGNVNVVKFKR